MADTKRTSRASPKKTERNLSLAQDLGKRDPFELLEQEVYINLLRTVDLLSVEFNTDCLRNMIYLGRFTSAAHCGW